MPALRAGARHRADPLAAEGPAQAARAGARTSAATVLESLRAAPRPLLEALAARDRAPARRAHPAGRLGPRAAAGAPADDVQRRGRGRQGARRRPGPRARCASRSAPTLRARAGGGDARARAHRPDDVDVRDDPEGRSRCRAPAQTIRAYPALVDEGETVGAARARERGGAGAAMRAGTRRLLALTIPSPLRQYQGSKLGNAAQLALMEAPHASAARVLDDAATAAIAALIAEAGGPVWDEAAFDRLRDHVAGNAAAETARIVGRRRADPAGRARGPPAAGRAARRRVDPVRARRRGAARPARLPRLRHAPPAPRGCPTSSATCAAPRGGWSGCPQRRRRPRPHAGRSTSSRTLYRPPARRSCRAGARGRRAARGPVAARGAADQPLRAGGRRRGPGVEPRESGGSSTKPDAASALRLPLVAELPAPLATVDVRDLVSVLETHDDLFRVGASLT